MEKIGALALFTSIAINCYVAYATDPNQLQDFCVGTTDPNSTVYHRNLEHGQQFLDLSVRLGKKKDPIVAGVRKKTHVVNGAYKKDSFGNLTAFFVNGLLCKSPTTTTTDDFLFKGLNFPKSTANKVGSNVTLVSTVNLPGLNMLGISMARIHFGAYGLNPPHTHPRATEILTVIKGKLSVGFVTSNKLNAKNQLFTKVLNERDVFVFPQGFIHFQQNTDQVPAVAIVTLSGQNLGAITIANAVFGSDPSIPVDVLAKAFPD